MLGSGKPHFDGDTLIIHTTGKLEKGLANRDVLHQVAKLYRVPSASVTIRSGLKSRKKLLKVAGINGAPLMGKE